MSRPDYGSMLERFNATDGRGDVLSFSREDAARLAELPLEIAAPILHALLKWFLTGEEVPLNDPRDRAMLAGFKEHQLGNAARRGKFLNDQKEKSEKAVQARKERNPRDTHGTPTDNPRDTQVIDKAKAEDKDIAKALVSLSSVDGTDRDGLTPSDCPSLSVEEAKKVLAIDAPPLSSHKYFVSKTGDGLNAEGRRLTNATVDAVTVDVATKLLFPDALNKLDEYDAETLNEVLNGENKDAYVDWSLSDAFRRSPLWRFIRNALDTHWAIHETFTNEGEDKREERTDNLFKRALLDAAISSKKPDVKNKVGFIIARLQKVAAAVKVLEVKKQLSDNDC